MNKIILSILVFLITASSVLCYESISKYWKKGDDIVKNMYFPKNEKWKSIYKNEKGEFAERISETTNVVNADGDIVQDSGDGITIIDKSLSPKKKEQYFKSAELVKKEGADRIVIDYTSDSKNVIMRKYINNKEIDKKSVAVDDRTIDIDPVFFRGMLLKHIGSFNADALAGPGKFNMDFELITTNNLEGLTKEYKNIPDEFKKVLKSNKEYYVYKMSLTGMAAMFYPHKHYFVFEKDDKMESVAYFGGDPKEAGFSYRIDKF